MAFDLGTNGPVMAEWESVFISPDLVAMQVQTFEASNVQAKSTVAHTAGDDIFYVDNMTAFLGNFVPQGDIRTGRAYITPLGGGATFDVAYYCYGGQNWIAVDRTVVSPPPVNGTDVNCPIGSLIENQRSNWTNPNRTDIYPPLIIEGINTGYPSGLRTNQTFRLIGMGNAAMPAGTWTLLAEGDGDVQINLLNHSVLKTVTFDGTGPTNSNTINILSSQRSGSWILTCTRSNPANPLRDIRFVCPGTAPNGNTYVQNYIDNKANRGYFQYHADFIRMHANTRQNGIKSIRQVNGEGINQFFDPTIMKEWADISPAVLACGNKRSTGVPHAWIMDLSKPTGADIWYGVNYRASDAWALRAAQELLARLHPNAKARIEYSNENWNPQYAHCFWMAAQWAGTLNKCVITRSGTTATVTKANHGLVNGDTVIITGAQQDAYNGEFTVAGATTNTFTYTVSGSPASPATAYTDSEVMCYKLDPTLVKDATSIVLNVSRASINWTIGLPSSHGYNSGDFVSLSGFQDPKLNGIYRFSSQPGANSGTLVWVYATAKDIPILPPGMGQAVALRSGATLRIRRVIANLSSSQDNIGIPQFLPAIARFAATRAFTIHSIARSVLGDRLIEVGSGHYATGYTGNAFNSEFLSTYQTLNGGTFPPAFEFATAPYFDRIGLAYSAVETMVSGGASQDTVVTAILDACEAHINGSIKTSMQDQVAACNARGIKAVFYECGQHIVYDYGFNPTANQLATMVMFMAAQRAERMGQLMDLYFATADTAGVTLGHYYNICGIWGRSGFWGSMEIQSAQDNPPPKYAAMLRWMGPTAAGTRYTINLGGGRILPLVTTS